MTSGDQGVSDEEVLGVVKSALPGFREVDFISLETDLWEAGMDSLANISVMVAVEGHFDVEFPDELLTKEVFTSPGSIASAVRGILGDRDGTD